MSDEIKDAARKVPRSMILSLIINGSMAWATMIVLLFCIGDPYKALEFTYVYPAIEIVYNATGSKAGTTVLVVMLAWNCMIALFNALASVSRLTWAFARDRGLPFPDTFGAVHPRFRIPLNALLLVTTLTTLLMLINIASTVALYAVVSVTMIGIFMSYLISILFFLLAKLRGDSIPYGPFRLGKWTGYAANVVAIVYCIFLSVWLPFPPFLPVTAANMNYAGPLAGAILLWALFDWFVWGHKRFVVPTTTSVFEPNN